MKFTGSTIPDDSFRFILSSRSGDFQYEDTLKKIVYIDNTLDFIDFGARQERIASMKLVNISSTSYQTIKDYLLNNSGKKILVQQEEGEEIFGPNITGSFYCYLLRFKLYGETAFSQNNQLYEIQISLSYSGEYASDEINTTSLIDFLIEVEPNVVGIQNSVSLIADLAGISSPVEGDATYVGEDKRVYYYTGAAWRKIDKSVNLNQKMLNNSSLGLTHGVFRWASFATTTLSEAYYNSFVSGNTNVGEVPTLTVQDTDDQDSRARRGVCVNPNDGTVFVAGNSGTVTINDGDQLCLRYDLGSTTPDVEATVYEGGQFVSSCMLFSNSGRIIMGLSDGTSGGKIIVSDDNGVTWDTKNTGLYGVVNLSQSLDGRLVACGSSGSSEVVPMVSSDDGDNWTEIASITAGGSLTSSRNGLGYIQEDEAFLIFVPLSGIYRSLDYGNTWTKYNTTTNIDALNHCYKIFPAVEDNKNVVYLIGNDSVPYTNYVYKSLDSGLTWSEVYSNNSGTFEDILLDGNSNVLLFRSYISGTYNTGILQSKAGTDNFETIGTRSGKRIDQSVLYDGVVYSSYGDTDTDLPTFETITVGNNLTVDNAFLPNIITKRSITFPMSNVDISDGPAVSTPQGFKFSIDNSDRKHIELSKYNFFGAKVRFYVYDATNDQKVLIRSGVNKNNSIDYFNYTFDVEPSFLYDRNYVLPDTLLGGSSLTSISDFVSSEFSGDKMPITYGRWDYGRLQNVVYSNEQTTLYTKSDPEITAKTFHVVAEGVSASLQYIDTNIVYDSLNSDFLRNAETKFVNIVYGGGGASGSTIINYLGATAVNGNIRIFFKENPSIANLQAGDKFEILARSIKFCIDEVKCKGFLSEDGSPIVYYYNQELGEYVKYRTGIFATENSATSIERSTQIVANVDIFENGLDSVSSDTVTVAETFKDDLYSSVYNLISEGDLSLSKPTAGSNSISSRYFPVTLPNSGAVNMVICKYSAGSDGGEADPSQYSEIAFRENFGSYSKYERASNSFTARWAIRDDSVLNFAFSRSLTHPLNVNVADRAEVGNKHSTIIISKKFRDGDIYGSSPTVTNVKLDQLYDERVTFSRFLQVTQEVRDNLRGAENVNLLLSQVISEESYFYDNLNVDSYTNGVSVVVEVVYRTGTKSTAFSGEFSLSLADVQNTITAPGTTTTRSFICFSNKPTWLGGAIDADFTSTSGTTTIQPSGIKCHTGRDLITLDSGLFSDTNYVFGDVVGMLIHFSPISDESAIFDGGVEKVFYSARPFPSFIDSTRFDIDPNEFYLSYENPFDIENGVFFAKLRGRVDDSGRILESPEKIGEDIYTNKLGLEASFEGLSDRINWRLRKQFFNSQNVQQISRELADNYFGSCVIDDDGALKFKSLSIEDYESPIVTFDDSNVLKDSVSKIKFRKATEIYNRFVINYHWDWEKNRNTKQVIIYLGDDDVLKIEGMPDTQANAIRTKYQDLFIFSKNYFGTGSQVTKTIDLDWFYDEKVSFIKFLGYNTNDGNYQPITTLKSYILKALNYYIFNSWEFSFRVPMSYTVYNTNVTGNKVFDGDFIRFKSYFYSNDLNVDGFVKGIRPDYYNGTCQITMVCTIPPEVLNNFYDYRWDGGSGSIDSSEYTIKQSGLWPFKDSSQVGTYPDGGTGDISTSKSDYQFTDDTYADAEEDYNPFDF